MVRIIDEQSSGKTGRLILLAKDNDGILVCHNPIQMKSKALGYGITGLHIISYQDYITHNFPQDKMIYIDELELFVQSLGGNLSGYSISEN